MIGMLLALPATARSQSFLSADLFEPAPARGDLLATRSAEIVAGRWEIQIGSDWAWHVMGVAEEEPGATTDWIVEHRLNMRVAAGFAPWDFVRLNAGFSGAVWQAGTRTDATGAEVPLESAWGDSWFAATWSPVPSPDSVFSAGLETMLRLPTASGAGLTGNDGIQVQLSGLLSARLDWFRLMANVGLITRKRNQFRDLTRDDGLIYRFGVELGTPDWPVQIGAELSGQSPLAAPFASGQNEFLETLYSVRVNMGPFGIVLGAGLGLLGAGVPAVRGVLLISWANLDEKRNARAE
jgi:hypothetical protein